MHISAPQAARPFGDRGPGARRELRDSERTYASTHAYLGIAGRGTRKGTVGCERAGDSERAHGCRRDAVTVCFQYLVPQVTVSDDSTIYSELAELQRPVLNRLCSIQN
jgi:hypothetical protein